MRVTSSEIAAICGVSQGTVDRALNNRTGINPKTKERVLAVARQLGYRPHLLARSLVKGCTMTIGVVVPNLGNPFFSQLVEVIQKRARHAGYYVTLMLSEYEMDEESDLLGHLKALNVDGIIISPTNRGRTFQSYVRSLGTPLVTINNRISSSWAWVGIDDRKAVRDAARFVLSRGYRRIIFVTDKREGRTNGLLYVDEQRILGYKDALQEAKPEPIPHQIVDDETMITMIREERAFDNAKSCIMCSCDAVALDVLNALKEQGVAVPGQVGLTGFDNLEELKYVTPRLTTVSYPIDRIGEEAFDCLMALIQGKPPVGRTLGHEIIPGETI